MLFFNQNAYIGTDWDNTKEGTLHRHFNREGIPAGNLDRLLT